MHSGLPFTDHVAPGVSSLHAQSLRFLVWKIGIMKVPASQGYCEDISDKAGKYRPAQCLLSRQTPLMIAATLTIIIGLDQGRLHGAGRDGA